MECGGHSLPGIPTMIYIHPNRIEILESHSVKPEHFPSMEEALKAADAMVKSLKDAWPGLQESRPDITIPGFPLMDQFYYFQNKGIPASTRNSHTH